MEESDANMGIEINDLIKNAEMKYLASLRFFRFVKTEKFKLAYSKANDEQKAKLIKGEDITQEILRYDLKSLKVRQLRLIASSMKIRNYHMLTKSELLEKINAQNT